MAIRTYHPNSHVSILLDYCVTIIRLYKRVFLLFRLYIHPYIRSLVKCLYYYKHCSSRYNSNIKNLGLNHPWHLTDLPRNNILINMPYITVCLGNKTFTHFIKLIYDSYFIQIFICLSHSNQRFSCIFNIIKFRYI